MTFSSVFECFLILGQISPVAIRVSPLAGCGFPAGLIGPGADAVRIERPHPLDMRRNSYAVWWTEGDGPRYVGKLELGGLHALLSGNGSKRLAVPLDDITAAEYRRGELGIKRRGATPLRIGSLDAPGTLLELAHSLNS
jgi:hypothetical protein